MWWLNFNLSVMVAVGFIALAGVAAETGVVMLIYLDQAMREVKAARAAQNRPFTRGDVQHAIMLGAVDRVRPKNDDGRGDHGRPAADTMEHRRRLRGHAAHC